MALDPTGRLHFYQPFGWLLAGIQGVRLALPGGHGQALWTVVPGGL